MFNCPKCFVSKAGITKLIQHLHLMHPLERVDCGLGGCPVTLANPSSFRTHVYKKHREVVFQNHTETEPVTAIEEADSQENDTIRAEQVPAIEGAQSYESDTELIQRSGNLDSEAIISENENTVEDMLHGIQRHFCTVPFKTARTACSSTSCPTRSCHRHHFFAEICH